MTREMRDLNKIREGHDFTFSVKEFKWMAGVAAMICVLTFVLGFLLGRHFPSDMLESAYAPEQTAGEYASDGERLSDLDSADSRSRFEFYEELSKKGTQIADVTAAGGAAEPSVKEPVQDAAAAGEAEGDGASGQMPGEEKGGVPLDQKAETTAAVQEKTSAGPDAAEPGTRKITTLYTVQVGAFEEAEGADKLAQNLGKKGYHTYTMVKSIPGKGVWHRVRVGKYESRSEAEHIASLLEDRENLTTFITLYAE